MIQATGDTGTQWILDLYNGIVKEGSIPEDWKSSVVLPIYKVKGDPMECGSYRGIKLLEHAIPKTTMCPITANITTSDMPIHVSRKHNH